MDKYWKNDQLASLRSENSIFDYIPEEIGKIIYCDTTEPRKFPYTKEEAKKRKYKGLLFSIISLTFVWGLLYQHYIWASILSLIALFIIIRLCDCSFNGTDYFIGDKGFSIISFENNRGNIIKNNTILFDNLSFLFTGETVNKTNFSYTGTDYYFTLYNSLDAISQTYSVAYNVKGSYSDKSPKDPIHPEGASEVYSFMKMIEKQWTLHFVSKHRNEKFLEFYVLKDNGLYDYIRIETDKLKIGGVEYNHMNTKRIYFSNGQLVVEHENHSKKLFGLIEKGDISYIPLSDLGNRQAFMLLFDNFYKI